MHVMQDKLNRSKYKSILSICIKDFCIFCNKSVQFYFLHNSFWSHHVFIRLINTAVIAFFSLLVTVIKVCVKDCFNSLFLTSVASENSLRCFKFYNFTCDRYMTSDTISGSTFLLYSCYFIHRLYFRYLKSSSCAESYPSNFCLVHCSKYSTLFSSCA
jgi:hypothetical protein